MSTTRQMTEADLLAAPDDGFRRELVDGEIIVMGPAGTLHGHVNVQLALRLGAHVEAHGLGYVLDSSTGFRLPNGNVRSPDLAFVLRERMALDGIDGPCDSVPDFAVEVLSPSESKRQVLDKVGEYLDAGVRLVWVIDPRARKAVAHRSLSDVRELREDDELDGEEVVPGFRCRLADVVTMT